MTEQGVTEPRRTAVEAFRRTYDTAPDTVWRAPGRVNLIGEHTDYNGGFVLPLALPQGTTAAIARRDDGRVRAVSTGMSERADDAIPDLAPGTVEGWAGYVLGVVWALRESGHELPGLDVVVDGDVPPGAGLSSSAALECAVAAAANDLFDLGLDRDALVAVARRAENDFVGVPSGMLDQSASLLCEAGHALLLDCRSGERRQVPFDLVGADLVLLVIDTRAPHQLVDGEYARRRQQCEQAARELGVDSLRDVAGEGLDERIEGLDAVLARRVRHVVTENARVLETVRRLDSGDPTGIGELLTASHASLRDDYEVSCAELDAAVDAAVGAGAYGARMTGGGFGGSAIALVGTDSANSVRAAVTDRFARAKMREPHVFAVRPEDGAHRLPG